MAELAETVYRVAVLVPITVIIWSLAAISEKLDRMEKKLDRRR